MNYYLLPGEPNNHDRIDEDCGSYITSATSDTGMRGSQATLRSGLNDCPCEQYNLGPSMPVVLCSRDPVPTLIPVSSKNIIPSAQFNLKITPALKLERAQSKGNTRFGSEVTFVLAFIALVGWVLFLCAVAYNVAAHRQVSTASWLRFWNAGARGPNVGPISLNGLNKLTTNREHNELKATTAARSISEGVPNVSSSIGPVVEGTQAEHYVPPPVQLRQNEPEVLHENDYESANKYTRMHDNKDEKKANRQES